MNLSIFFAIVYLISLAICEEAKQDEASLNWALLVAGSNEYYNYRHQVIKENNFNKKIFFHLFCFFFLKGRCLSCVSNPSQAWYSGRKNCGHDV